MPLTELPLPLPGHIFRSPMPFSLYDSSGELIGEYRRMRQSFG